MESELTRLDLCKSLMITFRLYFLGTSELHSVSIFVTLRWSDGFKRPSLNLLLVFENAKYKSDQYISLKD